VTEWDNVFLGVIAVATLVMALIQVGAIVVALKVARQAQDAVGKAQATLATARQTMVSVHEEIRPLIARATSIADEASKSAALATAQAQKIDRLVTDLSKRVDDTAAVVQEAIVIPAREGMAIVAAVRAGFAALRGASDWRRRTSRSEEEDPLFIG
jgi:type IV secretory pathway VirB2 component (pilin)